MEMGFEKLIFLKSDFSNKNRSYKVPKILITQSFRKKYYGENFQKSSFFKKNSERGELAVLSASKYIHF
jgi:hypothetical protein